MLSLTDWNWGAKAAFVYCGTASICLLWAYFCLPETKGRTFGEIDELYHRGVPAAKWAMTDLDAPVAAAAEGGEGVLGEKLPESETNSKELVLVK